MRIGIRLVLAMGVLLAAAPGAGAATTFGLEDWSSPASNYYGAKCDVAPCLVYSQGPVYASPIDGVIVRWQTDVLCTNAGALSGDLRLRVFRRGADKVTLLGASEVLTRNRCSQVNVATRVPIRADDEIGIQLDTANFQISASFVTPSSLFRVQPLPADGVESDDGDQLASTRLLIRAVVEPDFDKDGFGDETQDSDDDGDGLPDASDAKPLDPDSDDDGVNDGADECRSAPGPAPSGCPADTDGDGIPDTTETSLGSNPNNADSDGDGVADGSDQCIVAPGAAPRGCPAAPAADLPPSVAFTAPAAGAVLAAAGARLTATATDDRGIAAVEFIDDDVVLCRDTAAPFECQYVPDDRDVGQNLIVARATDSSGQQAVALRTLTVARFVALGLTHSSSARGSARRRTVTTTGKLSLPAGVRGAEGCLGRVSIQIKSGRSTVSRRVARLNSSCTYRSTVTLRRGGRLRVAVRFEGNATLSARRGPTRSPS